MISFVIFRYGDLTPITPLGRGLACLGAIYGISIVSMLVSVLVDRYQRVYTRKRFLNEEYSENMIFNDTLTRLNKTDDCLEGQIDIEKDITESNDQVEEKQDNDEPPSKVRFIIGYVSDDEDDDTDNDQDTNDGNENELINKFAQELFQVKSNKYHLMSKDNLQS